MAKREVVGRLTKKCESCGAEVTRKASAFKAHVFCSRTCYLRSEYHAQATSRHTRARYPDGRVQAPCLHCGVTVDRARSQANTRTYCSTDCRWAAARSDPARQVTSGGYIRVFVGQDAPGASKSGHLLEHRMVMQDHLGRALMAHENVHHINGMRDDNRLENLELWSTSQPPGQRVADKLKWAREFVASYEGVPIE